MIICISGLSGSGKTTLAEILKSKLDKLGIKYSHITSDHIGHYIFDEYGPDCNKDYTHRDLKTVYSGLYMLFEKITDANKDRIIITDGMYRKVSQRLILRTIASKRGVPFTLIKINARPRIAKRRLKKRHAKGGIGGWVDPSEYEDVIGEEHIEIDNNGDEKQLEEKADRIVKHIADSQ